MNCAIYTRVSTDNQAEVEFNSCRAQEEKMTSFINNQENLLVFMGNNVQEQRDFLKKFIEKIIVKDEGIAIVYYMPQR